MSLTLRSGRHIVPEGVYLARCYALVDLGTQTSRQGTASRKVAIGWELNTHHVNQVPFTHWQYYTANLSPRSVLKALLESWRGKKFSTEERAEFRLENMLGTSCALRIRHHVNANHHICWASVDDITPLPPGANCPALYHNLIHFDLDYYTETDYHAVPECVRKKINVSSQNCEIP